MEENLNNAIIYYVANSIQKNWDQTISYDDPNEISFKVKYWHFVVLMLFLHQMILRKLVIHYLIWRYWKIILRSFIVLNRIYPYKAISFLFAFHTWNDKYINTIFKYFPGFHFGLYYLFQLIENRNFKKLFWVFYQFWV